MANCFICHKSSRRDNLHMFYVPTKRSKREHWSKSCGRTLKDGVKVCELHFLKSDIVSHGKRSRLKSEAMPVALNFHRNSGAAITLDNVKRHRVESADDDDIERNADSTCLASGQQHVQKDEPRLVRSTFQFINEAIFDESIVEPVNKAAVKLSIEPYKEKENALEPKRCKDLQTGFQKVLATDKSVQTRSSPDRHVCALIEVTLDKQIYTTNCFFCTEIFPIWSWVDFVKHMKEQHKDYENQFTGNNENYSTNEIFEEINDDDVINNVDGNENEAFVNTNIENNIENSNSSITFPQMSVNFLEEQLVIEKLQDVSTPFSQVFYEDQSITHDDDERVDASCATAVFVDEVRFGRTDDAIVLDFLDLLKSQPVLWDYMPPDGKRAYDDATLLLAEKLNEKWNCNVTPISVRVSINRIKQWFRRVQTKSDIAKCRYPDFYKKCAEFLTDLDEHALRSHKVICEICNRACMDDIHLEAHKFKRHNVGQLPLKCRWCEHRFEKPFLLRRHENFHNKEKKFECNVCKKKFFHERHYYAHMEIHKICNLCGKICLSKTMYRLHKLRHEPPKHKCPICGKAYYRAERLREHIKVHRNQRDYICEECGKTFVRQRALATHKQSAHSNVRTFICSICERSFKTPNGLCAHRKKYHLVLEGTIEQLAQHNTDKLLYWKHTYVFDQATQRNLLVCDVCGNTYSRHASLTVHKVNAHGFVPFRKRQRQATAIQQDENQEAIEEITEITRVLADVVEEEENGDIFYDDLAAEYIEETDEIDDDRLFYETFIEVE